MIREHLHLLFFLHEYTSSIGVKFTHTALVPIIPLRVTVGWPGQCSDLVGVQEFAASGSCAFEAMTLAVRELGNDVWYSEGVAQPLRHPASVTWPDFRKYVIETNKSAKSRGARNWTSLLSTTTGEVATFERQISSTRCV